MKNIRIKIKRFLEQPEDKIEEKVVGLGILAGIIFIAYLLVLDTQSRKNTPPQFKNIDVLEVKRHEQ